MRFVVIFFFTILGTDGLRLLLEEHASLPLLRTSCPRGKPSDYPLQKYWLAARKMLNLPLQMSDEDVWFVNGVYTSIAGYTLSKNASTAYVHVWKCANDALKANMERSAAFTPVMDELFFMCSERSVDENAGGKCVNFSLHGLNITEKFIFSVVREPVSHFLSGYNEIEWRLQEESEKYTPKFLEANSTFLSQPLGSHARFIAFVEDFLMMRWPPHMHIMLHIFPMSGFLQYVTPHYVGHMTTLEDVWREVQVRSGLQQFEVFNKGVGKHESSSDPYNTYVAAKEVVKQNMAVRKALCSMVLTDYECFGFPLPSGCEDISDV